MLKPSVLHLESLLDQEAEPFKRLLQESLQHLLEAQMTQFVGAVPGERTQARTGYRAGHVTRSLTTRLGALELRVPRDRARRFSTELLDRYPRSERALIATLGQMFVRGCKVANVKAVAEELCGHALSGSTLQQIDKGLDAALARYERGALEAAYPCLILQARRGRVHLGGAIRSRVVLMAIGSKREGRRQVLGVELVNRVSATSWKALLRRLKDSGLHGVKWVAGDDHDGLRQAVRGTLGHCRLAPRRGALSERRAERSAARSALERTGRNRVAAPEIADHAPDSIGRPEIHGFTGRSAVDRPEERPPTGQVLLAGNRHDTLPAPLPRADWALRAALNPEARGHRALEDRQRSPMIAVLAGAVGTLGLLFWGMGPVVDPPHEIVSTATEAHGVARLAEPVSALVPPASVAPHPATTGPMRSRFQLSGVVAARTADGPGIALIGIDGGSPHVYRVGATVDGDLVLRGVTWDRATLGPARGPATVVLDVTAPAALSPAVAQAASGETWNVAGAIPSALAIAEATQSAEADAGSMLPMAVVVGDMLPPARRHRVRRLNAPR